MYPVYLGRDIHTHEPVYLMQDARLGGMYIIGKPGSGKTTCVKSLIQQDIEQGMGLCFFDIHRDATNDLLAWLPAHREKDVILLDLLDPDYTFGLNLFQCTNPYDKQEVSRINSTVMDVFGKLFSESGDLLKDAPNMAETLQNSIPVLLSHQHPRMTMAEIPLLLSSETARKKLLAPLTNSYVRNFWNSYNRWKPDRQEELTGSTRRRVGNFLIDPLILEIIGQSETTLPFRKLMNSGKILLVKLSRQHELITSLVGSVIVGQIANAAFSRVDTPEHERVQFNLLADEYQLFCTPTFAEVLAEVRKYKIATTVAHQFRDQIDLVNRGATLNTPNLVVYEVSGKDAEELAKQFDAKPPAPEIIGWRPVLTPKSDVVDHLRKQGHVNPHVAAFCDTYLIPAIRVVERIRREPYQVRVSPRPGEWKHKILAVDLDEAIHQFNTLLASVMRERNADQPIPPLTFWMFARLYGFSDIRFAFYHTRWSFWTGRPLSSWFHPYNSLLLICAPDFLDHQEELTKTIPAHILTPSIAFITQLRHVMQVLAADPILINTGQHEPIYDKPRQYQDVQNEIASSLANLPKFTAKVKIVGADGKPVEHTIQTAHPQPGLAGVALQERIKRIRAHNIHDGYIRDRDVVEKEIAGRLSSLLTDDKKQQTKQDED